MNYSKLLLLIIACKLVSCSNTKDNLTADQLLQQSITYHDPDSLWHRFQGKLVINMTMPGAAERFSEITYDRPNDYFYLNAIKAKDTITRVLTADTCYATLNGQSISKADTTFKNLRLSCEDVEMYRDYYTYLYGLPMKLQDSGTTIYPEVDTLAFHGVDLLRVKVKYEESVGNNSWYFYFDPNSYALSAYQFFHDDPKSDGEYIILKDELLYNGMRIPKTRNWYMNADSSFLGTDHLLNIKEL